MVLGRVAGAGELLGQTVFTQAGLFAVESALFRLVESWGVRPDAVIGHSVGEIAAAFAAGAVSLDDAARMVAARGRLMQALPPGGVMVAVAAGEAEVAGLLGEGVELAAVNGPSSVVLSGEHDAVLAVAERLKAQGRKTKQLAVSHAFHSAGMAPMLADFAAEISTVRWRRPQIPLVSNVTGRLADPEELADPGYWAEHVRRPVRFADGITAAVEYGGTLFVELGPGTALTPLVEQTAADVTCVPALRDGRPETHSLLGAMAELFVRGVPVDWARTLPAHVSAAHLDLPTYAFDHQHYWLTVGAQPTDAASLGLAGADHPMLGAVVQLPHSDGMLFTSRLSLRSHPWLADHRIKGLVVVPGTGLVELAVRAGDEAGCTVLDELVVEAPLVVPEHGGVRVQVALGAPDENGSRTVDVHSQREDAGDGTWTRHATGVLSAVPAASAAPEGDFTAWPPPGARPVEIDGGYDLLARAGYAYGDAFRAVRAVWRRGDEVFAEVALPEEQRKEAGGYGIHPALLDAALHAAVLDGLAAAGEPGGPDVRLPFAWNGLVLHAAGASALRVRITQPGPEAMALQAADEAGGLVVTLDSLMDRPVSGEQLESAADITRATSLFRVEWPALPPAQDGRPVPEWVAVADAEQVATLADDVLSGAAAPTAAVLEAVGGPGSDVLALTTRVLDAVRVWLDGGGLEESRLVVVTRGAVAAGDGAVTDAAGAAVWGLVRAAQAENPDRIVLLDLDADRSVDDVLGSVLACAEPQVAVRGTTLSVPRLTRAEVSAPADVFRPDGTVLVTGGTGALGGLLARHLVARHGVRRLVLASRRGQHADGAGVLVDELSAQGATVEVVACDVSDRDQVAALLEARRPTAVVHTAGVADAGVIGTVTPDRLAEVFAPKADAARHLDELTRAMGLELDAFVVYSSVSGVFMGAGSGSYATANAYLDGLMASRRTAGLPGLSLAWGLWEQTTGMAAGTDDLARSRMNRRGGLLPLTPAEGMALFDAAVRTGQSLLVPAKLDLRGVRAEAAAGAGVPHLLRGLVRAARQQAHTGPTGDDRGQLAGRLAALPAEGQAVLLLDLVRAQAADVLGHGSGHPIDPDQGLFEIGFDSLTAIELRNRLRGLTGHRLAPNLVFAHPTPALIAAHLHELLCGAQPAAPVPVSV